MCATTGGSVPPTESPVESTRSRIQATALDLFAAHGFEATSLQRIADQLGVTKAALYYHFPSKEQLLGSLVGDLFTGLDQLLGKVEPMRCGPGRARALLNGYLDLLLTHRRLVALFVQDLSARGGSAIGPRVFSYTERVRNVLASNDASPSAQIRAAAALGAVNNGVMVLPPGADGELRELVLRAAYAVLGMRSAGSGAAA